MRQNKLKIAVTGGIGSGKSTVCKILEEMGYPVFSCDKTYASMLDGGCFTEAFVSAFGDGILDAYGKPDRGKLSKIVFNDEEKLKLLNSLTHTKIFDKMFSEAEKYSENLCFFEVPILFECGYEKLFDEVIVVLRDEEERVKSVMARDNVSRMTVSQRIKKQQDYTNGDFAQYYVIHNNGKICDTYDIIKQIVLKFTNK